MYKLIVLAVALVAVNAVEYKQSYGDQKEAVSFQNYNLKNSDHIEYVKVPVVEKKEYETKKEYGYQPKYEVKYEQPKYEIKYEQPKYEIKYEQPKYQPKYEIKYEQPKYEQPKYEVKYEQPKYEVKYEQPKYEIKYEQQKYQPKYEIKYGY